MNHSAREAILASIGASPPDPDVEMERTYQVIGVLSKSARLYLFIDRLVDYGAGVFRCAESEIAKTIAARAVGRMVVPSEIPAGWLPEELDSLFDDSLNYLELESCAGAITGCAAAIAETGTIILDGGGSQGRRALTLLPDYHLCIVFENQVFETVPEAWFALQGAMSSPLTLISGPSATADIEMTRIQGVHGPRSMDVILVRETLE
jgi:L-lactate dehydrogenase complex protein LldG